MTDYRLSVNVSISYGDAGAGYGPTLTETIIVRPDGFEALCRVLGRFDTLMREIESEHQPQPCGEIFAHPGGPYLPCVLPKRHPGGHWAE